MALQATKKYGVLLLIDGIRAEKVNRSVCYLHNTEKSAKNDAWEHPRNRRNLRNRRIFFVLVKDDPKQRAWGWSS